MKKLWTTALMVMALVGVMTVSASAATVTVDSAEALETALAAGGDIQLTASIDYTGALDFNDELATVLDLNDWTLTVTTSATSGVNSAEGVTIKNGVLDFSGLSGTKATLGVYAGAKLTIDDVVYTSTGAALFPNGNAAELNVYSSTISAPIYCVGTNASTDHTLAITLKDSSFTSTASDGDNSAVYINVDGTLDIDNCQLTAHRQVLFVRGGEVSVDNTTLTMLAGGYRPDYYLASNWGTGNEIPSAAVVLGSRNNADYDYPTEVTFTNVDIINGGNHYAEYDVYMWGYSADSNASFTFDSASDVGVVYYAGGTVTINDNSSLSTGKYVFFDTDIADALTVAEDSTLTIMDGATLTIADTATLTNAGEIVVGTAAAAATQASFTALEDGTLVASAIAYADGNAILVIEAGADLRNLGDLTNYDTIVVNDEDALLAVAAEANGTIVVASDIVLTETLNVEAGTELVLEADLTITTTDEDEGLYACGDVVISGTGDLTINSTNDSSDVIGIYSHAGDIEIITTGDVSVTVSSTSGDADGICSYTGDVTISDVNSLTVDVDATGTATGIAATSDVTISGTSVTLGDVTSIAAGNLTIADDATLVVDDEDALDITTTFTNEGTIELTYDGASASDISNLGLDDTAGGQVVVDEEYYDNAGTVAWYDSFDGTTYTISTAAQLATVATMVNAGNDFDGYTIELTAAIDLSAYDNWTPIGYYTSSGDYQTFNGTFDGGNYKITNLTIVTNLTIDNNTDEYCIALFGYTDGATIENVIVASGSVEGTYVSGNYTANCVAGIVGYAKDTTIDNCTNYADITGYYEVGGIVGLLSSGSITNCTNYGDVTGTDTSCSYVGGIVGIAYGTITDCTNYGDISGESYCVGGIAGSAYEISGCVNSGAVTGTDYIGGITGYVDNKIISCTNTGDVTADGSECDSYVGGIVGYASGAEIAGCINTGDVEGVDYVGGIVGYIEAYTIVSTGTGYGAFLYNCYTGGDVTGTGENVADIYGAASAENVGNAGDYNLGFIIIFDADGGDCIYTAAVAADNNTITLSDATRSGYTFNGWQVDGEGDYVSNAKVYTEDTTLVADWTKNSSSSGGSSSYSSSVSSSSNGDVSISSSKSSSGTKITITTEPDDGYEVGTVTVTYASGKEVTVTDNGDGTYSYLQPGASVTVKVTFVSIDGSDDEEDELFSDVDADAYYYDAMVWAVENGITTGYTDGTFRATTSCTRAQVVTFLWRAAGEPEASIDNPFSDLDEDAYYYQAVLWAVENGITAGYTDGTFGADDTCTRGQIVTFMFRMDGEEAVDGDAMPDVDEDAYCYDSVMWAVENGITTGYTDGTFGPNDLCNRGQIVTFLYRYLG